METGRGRTVPEEILLEIVARLPLTSIARFKSVCKTWKSVTESAYFRRLFASRHKNSSSSWSLIFPKEYPRPIREAIGFHGCKTWDLPKSLGSYIFPFQPYPNLPTYNYDYQGSSNGLICIQVYSHIGNLYKSFVGNPVLQQWVEISQTPERCYPTGLVTRVEKNGHVSSFKVVMTFKDNDNDIYVWRVYVYSSETGLWTFKRLLSSHPIYYNDSDNSVNLNGMIYLWARGSSSNLHDPDVLIAYDFYSQEEADDQCRVIPLPIKKYNKNVRRCLTTSQGDAIYIEILDLTLKVWRLKDNNNSESSEWWDLLREINMASVGFDVNCYPMVMNPFDTDIVYLWSHEHHCLVSGNLHRQEFKLHRESKNWSSSEGCYRLNTHEFKRYMKGIYGSSRVFMLSQFVTPQWMDSVPTIRQI